MALDRLTQITSAGISGGISLDSITLTGLTTAVSFSASGNVNAGAANFTGIVTAGTFVGDGSGLTGVTASGSGINIKDTGATVGVAATIDFGTNVNVSTASAGIVTVTVGDTDLEIVDKIVHTGNTNTALRFPADNTVTVETNGSEALRVDSSGNIGVGSTQPTALLDVNGTLNVSGVSTFAGAIDANGDLDVDGHTELDNLNVSGVSTVTDLTVTGNLTVQGTTTTLDTIITEVDKLEVGANNTTVGVAITQSGTGDALTIDDGSTRVLTVADGGNIGIGTDNPASKLHLYSAGPQIQWTDSDNDSDSRIRYNGSLFIFEADPFNEIADSAFSFRVDGTNIADEKLRITSSGNVGIGTDDPQNNLEICSNNDPYKKISINPSASVNTPASNGSATRTIDFVGNNTGNLTEIGAIRWINRDGGSDYTAASIASFNDGSDSDGNLVFNITDGGTQAEALRITSGGNVGIGTDDPDHRLTVYDDNGSASGGILVQNALYSSNIDRPYLIAGTKNYDGTTTSWGTFGFQHRIKSNSGGVGRITIDTFNGEAFCVNNTNKVGLGTGDPQEKLHIHEGDIVIGQDSGATTNIRNYIKFGRVGAPKAAIGFINDLGSGRGDIIFMNDNDSNASAFGDSDEVLRITNDGNVGIGSTQPRALLDIAGGTTIASGGRLDVYRLSSSGNNTAFTINSDVGGTNSTKLVVTANGNTGIGSDAPEFPLDIGRHNGQGVVARFGDKTGGAVAITINDGGGNSNVTFNHTDQIPGQDGSSGRIHCAVDNTTALMEFELADSVTAGVQPTVTSVLQIRSDSLTSTQEHRFSSGISFDGGTNVLDSYEEGTLTLSVNDNSSGTGNSGSGTFNGYYTKIGNMVQVSIDLTNIDTTAMTPTNVFYIFGLPYNVQSLSGTQRFTSAVSHDFITYQASATNIIAFAQDNTSYIRLQYQRSGTSSTLVDCGDLTSGSADIRFNLWYQTGA